MSPVQLGFAILGWLVAFLAVAALIWPSKFPPVFDRGHRGYEAHTPQEREVIIKLLGGGGLKPVMRFCVGPTDQTLMSDGYTVVNLHNHQHTDPAAHFSGTFISLVCKNPESMAQAAMSMLQGYGYTAEINKIELPNGGSIIPVYCPRLGITVTYRRHAMVLGPPPNQIPV